MRTRKTTYVRVRRPDTMRNFEKIRDANGDDFCGGQGTPCESLPGVPRNCAKGARIPPADENPKTIERGRKGGGIRTSSPSVLGRWKGALGISFLPAFRDVTVRADVEEEVDQAEADPERRATIATVSFTMLYCSVFYAKPVFGFAYFSDKGEDIGGEINPIIRELPPAFADITPEETSTLF